MPANSAHNPNRLENYVKIHNSYIELFIREGFVHEDTKYNLQFKRKLNSIVLQGEIGCLGKIIIMVNKTLRVISGQGQNAMVKTSKYSYNASVQGCGNFLRYDNAHIHHDHPDPYHKHIYNFNLPNCTEGRVDWVGYDNWPTLDKVIEEVKTWRHNHITSLSNPDEFPEFGQSYILPK